MACLETVGGCFVPCRSDGVEVLPPEINLKEVADMSDYETLSIVILIMV